MIIVFQKIKLNVEVDVFFSIQNLELKVQDCDFQFKILNLKLMIVILNSKF